MFKLHFFRRRESNGRRCSRRCWRCSIHIFGRHICPRRDISLRRCIKRCWRRSSHIIRRNLGRRRDISFRGGNGHPDNSSRVLALREVLNGNGLAHPEVPQQQLSAMEQAVQAMITQANATAQLLPHITAGNASGSSDPIRLLAGALADDHQARVMAGARGGGHSPSWWR